jgi:hypothetical protein
VRAFIASVVSLLVGILIGYNVELREYEKDTMEIRLACVSRKIRDRYCAPFFAFYGGDEWQTNQKR